MAEHVPKVLVVDDEEHITELLKMGLSMNGFDVERAATGRGALQVIEKSRPDIVVLEADLSKSTMSCYFEDTLAMPRRTRSRVFAWAATIT